MIISDEIKVRITSKIKGIQDVSDWSMFDISSISHRIDIAELDENNVKNERIVWENVAKLSIDLFLDYDYYKQFTFQNDFRGYDYDEKLRKLGFNDIDGFWISERKPDKETVIRNVFLSCLYRSIELKMANENQTDSECGINANNDGDIEVEGAANAIGIAGDAELMNCDAGQMNYGAIGDSYGGDNGPTTSTDNGINIGLLGEVENERRMNDKFEMEENKIKKETKVEKENNIKANAKIENESKINECKAIDNHLNLSLNMKIHLMSSHKDEWLCESCELLNSYQFQHCSICVKPRQEIGLWICMGCSFVNEMRFSNCRVCEAVNELNKSKAEARKSSFDCSMIPEEKHSASQDKRKHKKKEKSRQENFDHSIKYRCWNRACNQFNYGTSKFCSKCDCKAPTESENASGPQESNHGKSDPEMGNQGTWNCSKCLFVNQQGKKQCELCNWKKGKIKQNNHIINDQSEYWQCWHWNCKQMNKSELCYCHTCGLYRYGDADDGNIVRCKNKSGIRDIWICASCLKFNDILDYKCAGKNCQKDRFHNPNSKK